MVFDSLYPTNERSPVDVQGSPALPTECAGEDHVLDRFFNVESTQEAVVIVTNVVVTSFEHISGVQPVIE